MRRISRFILVLVMVCAGGVAGVGRAAAEEPIVIVLPVIDAPPRELPPPMMGLGVEWCWDC